MVFIEDTSYDRTTVELSLPSRQWPQPRAHTPDQNSFIEWGGYFYKKDGQGFRIFFSPLLSQAAQKKWPHFNKTYIAMAAGLLSSSFYGGLHENISSTLRNSQNWARL